jgi:hypothetical protein
MAGESKKPALTGDAEKVGSHYDRICELSPLRRD